MEVDDSQFDNIDNIDNNDKIDEIEIDEHEIPKSHPLFEAFEKSSNTEEL